MTQPDSLSLKQEVHDTKSITARGWAIPPATLIVITAVLVTNLVYLAVDQRPYQWDDAWYAETSVRLNDAWTRDGVVGGLSYFLDALGSKAPLIVLLPQPLLWLFGRSDFVFGLTSALSLVAASVYLALLVRMFVSARAATVAVLVFSLMPLTSGMARQFMVEMPLTVLLLMFVYHLARSCEMTSTRHALWAGVAAGLGMLAKITFPLFVVGLFAALYYRLARRHGGVLTPALLLGLTLLGPGLAAAGAWLGFSEIGLLVGLGTTVGFVVHQRRRWDVWRYNWTLALSVALWLPFPWYARNAEKIFSFALSASFGDVSMNYGASELFSLEAIRDYWIANVNFGFGVVFVLALAALVVCLPLKLLFGGRRGRASIARLRPVRSLVAVWVIPALIVFTLGRNRSPRFLMPLLPAAALLYASLYHVLSGRLRFAAYLIVAIHVCLATGTYLISSFGGPAYTFGPNGRFLVCCARMSGRGAAENKPFPLVAILHQAMGSSRATSGRTVQATFLTDTPFVNLNSLAFTAAKVGADAVFNATAYQGSVEDAMGVLATADVLIYQEGGENGPEFSNRWGREIRRRIDLGSIEGWRMNQDVAIALPDGGVVRFYERADRSAAARPLAESNACCVLYRGGSYALLGIAMHCDGDGLALTTHWVKLRPDDGRYVIAAHLIDESGTFAHNIDHYPAGGEEAFSRLALGEAVSVTTRVSSGEWASKAVYLRLALYDLDLKRNVDSRILEGIEALQDNWGGMLLPKAQRRR